MKRNLSLKVFIAVFILAAGALGSTTFFTQAQLPAPGLLFPSADDSPKGVKQSVGVFNAQLEADQSTAPAATLILDNPTAIALSFAGELFILDTSGTRIVRYDAFGNESIVFQDDGNDRALPATYQALFANDGKTVLDNNGQLYLVDAVNHRVTRTGADLQTETIAGTGTAGYNSSAGNATQVQLDTPTALALDANGTLYILDSGNGIVRRVTVDGQLSTVAGVTPDQVEQRRAERAAEQDKR